MQYASAQALSDELEFAVNGEKFYHLPLLGMFNGEVISYSLQARSVMGQVHNAGEGSLRLNPGNTSLLNSDQGRQYQMADHQGKLKAKRVLYYFHTWYRMDKVTF